MADKLPTFDNPEFSNDGGVNSKLDGAGTRRLCVDAIIDPTPAISTIKYRYLRLIRTSDSRENANVDGSTTPQEFEFAIPSGSIYILQSISIMIIDTGTSSPNNYGAIAGPITNGTKVLISRGSGPIIEEEIFTLKDNKDITLAFNGGQGSPSGSAWLDSIDSYYGTLSLSDKLTLDGDNGDKIVVRVADNLTGLDHHYFVARTWEK